MAKRTVTTAKLRSQGELAAFLGISRQRVGRLLQDDEWRWGSAPWSRRQAKEIERWLSERRARANAGQGRAATEPDEPVDFDDLQAALRDFKGTPAKLIRLTDAIEGALIKRFHRARDAGEYV